MIFHNILHRIVRREKINNINLALKNQFLTKQELEELQNAKFLRLVSHARTNVPYYRELLKDVNIESMADITKISFLTKELIKKNFQELKSTNFKSKHFIKNSTSGSTGNTLVFFSDKTDYYSDACRVRGDTMTGYNYGEKSVIIWGARTDIPSNGFKKFVNKKFRKYIILSSFKMTNSNMIQYLELINKFKPALIVGYPTGLYLFADFISNNKLSIHSPKGIISGGETLFEFQRQKIQDTFNTKVLNRYGCRDVNHIAGECIEQKGLHISTDHLIVEVIDEKGGTCKPGELGEIVITDLDNYAFPFIRYKIGDLGILSDRVCSCGRSLPLLEKVEGRVFDIIEGTNMNRVTGSFWTLLRYRFNGIENIQVIQEKRDEIRIKLVTNISFSNLDKESLIKAIKEQLGDAMKIEIEDVNEIPPTESGKYRWVISKVSPFHS